MLVTNRMWRFTRWMRAAWWRPLPAEAPAKEQRLGRPMPLRTTFPRGRLRSVHTFSSRPTRRWPCLIRSGRAAEGAVPAGGVEGGAVGVAREAEGRGGGVAKAAPGGARAEGAAPAAGAVTI